MLGRLLRKFLRVFLVTTLVLSAQVLYAAEHTPSVDSDEISRSSASTSDADLAAQVEDDEEYNFSWLDPDKKVYVLQNRRYRKEKRIGVTLSGGMNLTNSFRSEYVLSPRVSYWFNHQFGAEVFYANVTNSENATYDSLKRVSSSALPFVREHRNYYAALGVWSPWYAKINFFNKILYFDWFVNLGVGRISTAVDQNNRVGGSANVKFEDLTAFFYGTGQNFYINDHFSVRWDLIGSLYTATGADNVTQNKYTNFDLLVGVGYLF